MPEKSDNISLTPVSEILRNRANVFMELYGIRRNNEEEFYDNIFLNIIDIIEGDNKTVIGVDACFLIPFILIHKGNFSFAHISQFNDLDINLYDEILKYLIKNYFSFMNVYHIRHLLEYLFPFSNIQHSYNGRNEIIFKISVNVTNDNLLKYSISVLNAFLTYLNFGKLVENKGNIEVILPYQNIVNFRKHKHQTIRVHSNVIVRRDGIATKLGINPKNRNQIHMLNDLILYQNLNILDYLFKNNMPFHSILYNLYNVYSLFLELRKTGHIIIPRQAEFNKIDYKLIDPKVIQKNLDMVMYLISTDIKVYRNSNKEIIIESPRVLNNYVVELIKYTFNISPEIVNSGKILRVKIENNVFV